MILLRPKEDLAVVKSSVAILGVCHVDDGDDDVHRGVVRANRLLHNLVQPSLTINSLWLFMGSTLKGGRGELAWETQSWLHIVEKTQLSVFHNFQW